MKKIEFDKKYLVGVLFVVAIAVGIFIFQNKNTNKIDNQNVFGSTEVQNTKEGQTLKSRKESAIIDKKILVDITGAVKKEGVFELKNSARLIDLINRAGGLLDNANLKAINRAQKLNDQDKIYIPFKGEEVPEISSNQALLNQSSKKSDGSNNESKKININTASESELMELNGIGQKKAQLIIEFRTQNGPFKSPKDLTKVNGIGEKTLENMVDQITT